MAVNVILNGDFERGRSNWTGVDIEINPERAYLGGSSRNRVTELDGRSGRTTQLNQTFTINGPLTTALTLDAALRNAALSDVNIDGFRVQIFDSLGNAIVDETVFPQSNSFVGISIPVTFPAAGDYTLRLTEIGDDDSLGPIVDNIALMVCLAEGSLIRTPQGDRAIETLRVGELVDTTKGPSALRWIGQRSLDAEELASNPRFAPVRITGGALGQGLPCVDLLVSRQHRMLCDSPIAKRMFGTTAVLVAAIRLTTLPGIYVDHTVRRLRYYHLLFDTHEVIFANGAPTESLWTGPEALNGLGQAGREEVYALFPQLREGGQSGVSAFPIPPNRRQQRFVARLQKNDRSPLA